MKSHEVRQAFIDYFKKQDHAPVASSRLIPENDPTLLFTNAGMNQFKNVFLGLESRDYKRAVSSQKCVRAGGKHNDLENVGHTARHHTFFEMLGNFSFGDYFKKEAIHYAWEFVTKDLGLDKKRLYVSVFKDDDEAANIWHKQEGVAKDRIYRFGEKDNFWRMGNSGPCGPCSEIFYDLGPEVGGDPKENVVGGEGDRYVEFWNLVFMQFNESEDGTKTPLPNPSIDTGSGLERVSAIMQGEINNYHTDLFQELIGVAMKISGHEYLKSLAKIKDKEKAEREALNMAFRVVADHSRAAAFLIADGVLPSNDGRGYVLRRIMRRGIRYARKLSQSNSLMVPVVENVIASMGDAYPELVEQKQLISTTMRDEEARFLSTLDQGTHILENELKKLSESGQKTLDGKIVFKLYDTFGFPADLTRVMANEHGCHVDEAEFERRMEQAREKAKASWKGKALGGDQAHYIKVSQELLKQSGPTEFKGYDGVIQSSGKALLLSDGKNLRDSLKSGDEGVIACDQTCFYAESGGQVGDQGLLVGAEGQAEVLDTTKVNDIFLHHIKMVDGVIKKGEDVLQKVTTAERRNTACNHSATHLMHAALKTVLGSHVNQAGSLVDSQRLRFDFTHNKPVSEDEIRKIEDLVNREISAARTVATSVMSPDEAKEQGALALFGEKYGNKVRVVKMGDFSMELCGGTHVDNTAMIRLFKVVSEGSVSSGVRRIEAITGDMACRFLLQNTRENLKSRHSAGMAEPWMQYLEQEDSAEGSANLTDWMEKQRQEIKGLQKQLADLKGNQISVEDLINGAIPFEVGGKSGKLVLADVPVDDRKVLSEIGDKVRDKIQSGVVIIVGTGEKSHPIIVSVTKDLVGPMNAGQILKEISQEMGGKGGGRPDFAQGAGPNRQGLNKAFDKAKNMVGLH
ncbi:MAG: alanine--tRNA ligase [Bdellovibrionaceae bacterium]|nr:alanine--tRNA ligase [Pseudobdellovibrionaceae bacterium]